MKGRKRHVLVDTLGLVLKVVVSAADVQDRDGGRLVGQAIRQWGPTLPRLVKVWADSAYAGALEDWLREHLGWEVEIVKRVDEQQGFVVQAHRWIVERTLSWWGGFRRLAKDYEYQVESSEALIYAAMSHLMARRLAQLNSAAPG